MIHATCFMIHVCMFNHNTLEQDIERLSREVSEKKELPESRDLPEREIIKQAIEPLVKVTDNKQQTTNNATSEGDDSVLPGYLNGSSDEVKLKVEKLIDSVFHNGLDKAVGEAKAAGPYILDAFHDALTDKLYEELKSRNLI